MEWDRRLNLCSCGCAGCHIAVDSAAGELADWTFCSAPHDYELDPADRFIDEAQVHVEVAEGKLSVMSFDKKPRVVYVSLQGRTNEQQLTFIGKDGTALSTGVTSKAVDEDCDTTVEAVACITFICLVQPCTALCLAATPLTEDEVDMYKLDFRFEPHPEPMQTPKLRFEHFPLGKQKDGPWLCTQGCGGGLTHFFPESYHAIDLRCSEGTPVLAVGDGVVTEVLQEETASGIHCHNLSCWNSIAIALKPGGMVPGKFVVEYLHIQPGSAVVKEGDRVTAGQQLCLAGQVGFAPEPHLHLEVHNAADMKGPSVAFDMAATAGEALRS